MPFAYVLKKCIQITTIKASEKVTSHRGRAWSLSAVTPTPSPGCSGRLDTQLASVVLSCVSGTDEALFGLMGTTERLDSLNDTSVG